MAFSSGVARGRKRNSLDAQAGRIRSTVFGGMRRAPIFKQHDLPTTPMAANDLQEVLMSDVCLPGLGNQQLESPVPMLIAPCTMRRAWLPLIGMLFCSPRRP